MKIAVLILSNSSPHTIAVHEEYWSGKADLYIHLDAKVDNSALGNLKSAHVIPQTRIFWGGWSMIVATMNLINAAITRSEYDRFILISDDSAPLLPVAKMCERLAERREFIWSQPIGDSPFSKRYSEFYFVDHPAASIGFVGIEDRALDTPFFEAIHEASRLRRMGKKKIDLRHGLQWWALQQNTIEIILSSYNRDLYLKNSFRFSAVPDEHYIPTILGKDIRENFMYAEIKQYIGTNVFNSKNEILSRNLDNYLYIRKVKTDNDEMLNLISTGML